MRITTGLTMFYNTDSPKRGSSDIENVCTMYNGKHCILQVLLHYSIYSHLFVQHHLVACTVGRFVGPDLTRRSDVAKQMLCRTTPTTNKSSLEQRAKCNGRIIDSRIQAGSICHSLGFEAICTVYSATLATYARTVEPEPLPSVALADYSGE
jgi:hypothetical protein